MKCKKCGYNFNKEINTAIKVDTGEKITVCPKCGNEDYYRYLCDDRSNHKNKIK